MGILEQIFPKSTYDDIKKINGMNITFVRPTAKTDIAHIPSQGSWHAAFKKISVGE